jgi:hypothetical protein
MKLVVSTDQVRVPAVCARRLVHELEWRQELSRPEYDVGPGRASGSSVGLNNYHTIVREVTLYKGRRLHQEKS